MNHIEPSHYRTPRIKLHALSVTTHVETTTPSEAPICRCCKMLVPYVENASLYARDVEVDVSVSYVHVVTSDTEEPDVRLTETVQCCAWCAGEFVSELSPVVFRHAAQRWFGLWNRRDLAACGDAE